MNKIKFGVIGLGSIANTFCGDLMKSEKAMLYAVASRSLDKANEFAQKYGAEKIYDSYEKIANDKNVDIIYVATPHVFHKDISIMCMNAGKHVLCEKPAGVNEKQLKEMVDCAKRNDVFFMEGMWTRFFPISQKIKEIIKSKELGEVQHIEANFGFGSWHDENLFNDEHRLYSPKLAGGAILDVGIYPVAFAAWLKEKSPKSISTFAKMTPLGVDGNTTALIEYDDNCLAMLQCSVCQHTSEEAKVYFDYGKIELDRFFRPHNMKITYTEGGSETISDDYKGRGFNGFIYEIDHVADCINKGLKMSPSHTWKDSLEIIKVLDAMRKQIMLKYPFE